MGEYVCRIGRVPLARAWLPITLACLLIVYMFGGHLLDNYYKVYGFHRENKASYTRTLLDDDAYKCNLTYQINTTDIESFWEKVYLDKLDTDIFIGPIYMDTRVSIEQPDLRILAVVSRYHLIDEGNIHPHVELYCHQFYSKINSDEQLDIVTVSKVYIYHNLDHKAGHADGHKVYQYILSCPAICKVGYSIRHVSVSDRHCGVSKHPRPVIYPPQESIGRLAICVPTLYGDLAAEPQAAYDLVEWTEIYRMFGVKEFFMYNCTMLTTCWQFAKVLEYYQEQNVIRFVTIPPITSNITRQCVYDISKSVSRISNNMCLLYNMFRFQYVFPSDLDDILIPRNLSNYDELFHKFNISLLNAVSVRARHFSRDISPDIISPYNLITSKYFIYREITSGWQSKGIVSTQLCDTLWNHGCNKCPLPYHFCKKEHSDKPDLLHYLRIHHYRKSCDLGRRLTEDSIEIKSDGKCFDIENKTRLDTHTLTFADQLYNRVKHVKELLNFPLD